MADFFDLADALFDADSLQRALAPLDRIHLAALVVLGRAATALTADEVSALLAAEPATAGVHRDVVAAALNDLAAVLLVEPAEGGRVRRLRRRDRPARRVARAAAALARTNSCTPRRRRRSRRFPDTERRFTDRLAAERAFESVAAVSELLAELGPRGRAARLQKGGLALPAVKRLAEALVDRRRARSGGSLGRRASGPRRRRRRDVAPDRRAPPSGRTPPAPDRWRALAAAWLDALPPTSAPSWRCGAGPRGATACASTSRGCIPLPSTRRSGGWMRTRGWPNGSASRRTRRRAPPALRSWRRARMRRPPSMAAQFPAEVDRSTCSTT